MPSQFRSGPSGLAWGGKFVRMGRISPGPAHRPIRPVSPNPSVSGGGSKFRLVQFTGMSSSSGHHASSQEQRKDPCSLLIPVRRSSRDEVVYISLLPRPRARSQHPGIRHHKQAQKRRLLSLGHCHVSWRTLTFPSNTKEPVSLFEQEKMPVGMLACL